MNRGAPLLLILVALAAHAGEHTYRSGTLKRIDIKDVTSTIPIQTGTGDNLALPLPLGINYQFQVQSDTILYVGNCWSRDKRGYGSEWVVNDPVGFRVDKDQLFLKRPTKGELRLALMVRYRVLPSKDEAGTERSALEPLPALATRQTVPQCH
jgi:hypothetical protein